MVGGGGGGEEGEEGGDGGGGGGKQKTAKQKTKENRSELVASYIITPSYQRETYTPVVTQMFYVQRGFL